MEYPVSQLKYQESGNQKSLIQSLLVEQKDLTAVEEFSRFHDQNMELDQSRYSNLLPVTSPGEGEQYSFDVNLDACSGCKACVTACHSLNGLDQDETWRSVGILHGGSTKNPFYQHVTSACHHCLEPACMIGCPVDAYTKDPVTGIVKHLDDQCFGCQYCTLACPYDVPQYNPSKGIVRKCDMCSDRLSEGEAPACVQSCPNEAIAIQVIKKDKVLEDTEAGTFLPGTIDPVITLPTTTFRTNRVFPRNLLPADYFSFQTEHAHWPLILMLVLSQMSVGAFFFEAVINHLNSSPVSPQFHWWQSLSAFFVLNVALLSSLFHLGRPHLAFRAVIGLKHSWLSREIVAFSLFAFLGFVYTSIQALRYYSSDWDISSDSLKIITGDLLAGTGIAGVICSVMIYQFTKRELWNGMITSIKFLMTSVILGLSLTLVTLLVVQYDNSPLNTGLANAIIGSLAIFTGIKLVYEASLFLHLKKRRNGPFKRAAHLMKGQLRGLTKTRFLCGSIGGIFLPLLIAVSLNDDLSDSGMVLLVFGVVSLLFSLVGELLERYLFFVAVSPAGMPGGIKT